jgi:hypothetical protein
MSRYSRCRYTATKFGEGYAGRRRDKVRDYKVKGGGITKRMSRLLKHTAVTVLHGMKERGDKWIAK